MRLKYLILSNYKEIPNVVFFIDKDFTNNKTNENVYITPTYSIENLYVNEEGLSKILIQEFFVYKDSELYNEVMNKYRISLKKFLKDFKKFNLLMIYNYKNELGIMFNEIKTLKIIRIENLNTFTNENNIVDFNILLVRNNLIIDNIRELDQNNNIDYNERTVRGKNLIEFFIEYVRVAAQFVT